MSTTKRKVVQMKPYYFDVPPRSRDLRSPARSVDPSTRTSRPSPLPATQASAPTGGGRVARKAGSGQEQARELTRARDVPDEDDRSESGESDQVVADLLSPKKTPNRQHVVPNDDENRFDEIAQGVELQRMKPRDDGSEPTSPPPHNKGRRLRKAKQSTRSSEKPDRVEEGDGQGEGNTGDERPADVQGDEGPADSTGGELKGAPTHSTREDTDGAAPRKRKRTRLVDGRVALDAEGDEPDGSLDDASSASEYRPTASPERTKGRQSKGKKAIRRAPAQPEANSDRCRNPDRPLPFMHWRDDKRRFVPDRIYLHQLGFHEPVEPGKKGYRIATECIEENGGKIVDELDRATVAVLPRADTAGYRDLYWRASARGIPRVQQSWVIRTLKTSCSEEATEQDYSYRADPLASKHRWKTPPPPTPPQKRRRIRRTDEDYDSTSSNAPAPLRYVLKPQEEDKFEDLIRKKREVSFRQIWGTMQNKFFDKYRRSSLDYEAQFPLFLNQLQQRRDSEFPAQERRRREKRRSKGKHVDDREDEFIVDLLEKYEDYKERAALKERQKGHPRTDSTIDALSQEFKFSSDQVKSVQFHASDNMARTRTALQHLASARQHLDRHDNFQATTALASARSHLWSFEQDEQILSGDPALESDGRDDAAWETLKTVRNRRDADLRERLRFLKRAGANWSLERGTDARRWRRQLWAPSVEELR